MSKFWMVWNERGHAPTYKHETELSAKTEAERLARLNPGHMFHVLERKGACKKIDVLWTGTDSMDDEIPF